MIRDQKKQSQKLAESSLKYLIFLTDVDKLCDVALGMYDFDLAIFVSRRSNNDPKEFIQMINDLLKVINIY